jgi:hypothetical protein
MLGRMLGFDITSGVGVPAFVILLVLLALLVASLGWMAFLHLSRQRGYLYDALAAEKHKKWPAKPTL